MPAKSQGLSLEFLCVHHSLDEFSSGDPLTDHIARELHKRTRQRDVDDIVTFVVARTSGAVVGIVSVVDLTLQSDVGTGRQLLEGKCLFYSLLAVDHRFRSGPVLFMLLDEGARVRERRFSEGGYLGELAAPLSVPGSRLPEFLEQREFRRLRSDEWLWFRASRSNS